MNDAVAVALTAFFQEPFWIGVLERLENGRLSVCKVTFGAEPKDYEVHEYMLKQYFSLRFSSAVEAGERKKADNPKRRQREASKQIQNTGVSTKSQMVLQMQREAMKSERKQISKAQREAEEQRRFELKQQKKKEKKRGH
jgi:hypothetical protein